MGFDLTTTIESIDCYPIETSNAVSPKMAIGTMPIRPALLVRITDTDGCFGWGEVWANFPPRAHQHKAHIIEDVVAPKLRGMAFVQPEEIQTALRDRLGVYFLHVGQERVFEHILAGVDIALWDLVLRNHSLSIREYFNLTVNSAPCYASSINAEEIDEMIQKAASLGQRYFKIKIGFQEDNGRGLVKQAAESCPETAEIMIDSNQSWSLEQATEALHALEEHQPFFAEEPMRSDAPLADWEALAGRTTIPLAAGENIYGHDNFVAMANVGLAVVQPDVAKWGGVSGALNLAKTMPAGTKLWPHFMGTAVGQMASLAVTAAIGGDAVCEMDVNVNPMRTELCGEAMLIQDGSVQLTNTPGLVVPPFSNALEQFLI